MYMEDIHIDIERLWQPIGEVERKQSNMEKRSTSTAKEKNL